MADSQDKALAAGVKPMSVSLQELLKLELPIIQAPMAAVQGSALAITVSNASGCREIPAAQLTRELAQSL